MQARYYDPVIGRFLSNDPVGYSNTHNFNRYAYANNNPYKYVDPDGENAIAAARISFRAGYKVGGYVNTGINTTVRALTDSSSLGGLIYDLIHNNESSDPVDGIKEGKSPAKGEAGDKGQLEGVDGQAGALEDLGSIPLEEGSEWSSPDGSRQGGTLGDGSGRKVNVHPSGGGDSYPKGTPTLEVQKPNGKTDVKIRYPENKSNG